MSSTEFTEGVLIDVNSAEWKGCDLRADIYNLNQHGQLYKIENQPRKRDYIEINNTDHLFPNSVFIIRESMVDRIYSTLDSMFNGKRFPDKAAFIILKEYKDDHIITQFARDNLFIPYTASGPKEAKILVRSHLKDLDPAHDNGPSNIRSLENDINDVTEHRYEIVPDGCREEDE